MKNPLLKYVINPDKEEVFHSSAFARAQNGGNIGSASSETFANRRRLDQNRQFIRGYGDSNIGNASNPALRAKTYEAAPQASAPRPPLPKNPGIQR